MAALDYPVLEPATPAGWETWLRINHAKAAGVWLRFRKKAHASAGALDYAAALDVALCWGWIDGQVRGGDAQSYLQKFTPRKPKSVWSQINRGHIARLDKAGRMQPAGLAAVEAAKHSGAWDRAYAAVSKATPPADLLAALEAEPAAAAFFATLNSQNRYAVLHRIETAIKPETRQRRIQQFVAMLAQGEKIYP